MTALSTSAMAYFHLGANVIPVNGRQPAVVSLFPGRRRLIAMPGLLRMLGDELDASAREASDG